MEWYSAVQSRIFHNFLQCEVQLQVALKGVADSMRNVAERISDWQRTNLGLTGTELAEKLLALEEEVLGGAISHAEKVVKEHKLMEQQKRKEKAGKWAVPIPKVRPIADDEMFKAMATGKRKAKSWKRVTIWLNA